jgi:uncharacterized hydrophobic protein (TIGR00271 family)
VLHLRLHAPSELTPRILDGLLASGVATNISVHPASGRDPEGDLVLADVAREAASDVLDWLRRIGVEERGSIAVEEVDLTLSRGARNANRNAPGKGSDAIVWEAMAKSARDETSLTVSFLVFFAVATMLAGIAVLLDSAILVVGAMIVGPEFGALAGICTGTIRQSWDLARRSALALLVGFPVGIVATVLLTWLITALDLVDETYLTRPRPQTSFIFNPDAMSFVVALLAGIAGMLALTSARSGAVIGVLVSVTTIPAAGNAAVATAYGEPEQAWTSLEQLGLNLAGIVVAGIATLLVQQAAWRRVGRRKTYLQALR